jgi:hypothetical protein
VINHKSRFQLQLDDGTSTPTMSRRSCRRDVLKKVPRGATTRRRRRAADRISGWVGAIAPWMAHAWINIVYMKDEDFQLEQESVARCRRRIRARNNGDRNSNSKFRKKGTRPRESLLPFSAIDLTSSRTSRHPRTCFDRSRRSIRLYITSPSAEPSVGCRRCNTQRPSFALPMRMPFFQPGHDQRVVLQNPHTARPSVMAPLVDEVHVFVEDLNAVIGSVGDEEPPCESNASPWGPMNSLAWCRRPAT